MNTLHGTLVDTLIGGQRYYQYTQTETSAQNDHFTYYFNNQVSGRITKATVWIEF